MERFADNLARLLGLHRLTARGAAEMLDLSESALAKWGTGLRRPSFDTALRVSDFFGVGAQRLAQAQFEELLADELADPDRFRAVEKKIQSHRVGLRAVDELEAGAVVDVVTGESVSTKSERENAVEEAKRKDKQEPRQPN